MSPLWGKELSLSVVWVSVFAADGDNWLYV